jgi:hypothetical protein
MGWPQGSLEETGRVNRGVSTAVLCKIPFHELTMESDDHMLVFVVDLVPLFADHWKMLGVTHGMFERDGVGHPWEFGWVFITTT